MDAVDFLQEMDGDFMTSGSMMGLPIMVAKALTAAVAIIAWRRNRNVVIVKYSDSYSYKNMGNKPSSIGELSKFLSMTDMGGNNENRMFQGLFTEIKPTLPEYDTADVLCVSDFGWGLIDDGTKKLIESEKQNGMRIYGLNVYAQRPYGMLGDDGMLDGYYTPRDVCDSLWVYEDGECRDMG